MTQPTTSATQVPQAEPRRIVICLDGTGNQVGAKNHHTNVVKLYEMLDVTDPDRQLVYYDPGVGTMSAANARGWFARWWSRVCGLAFGSGLKTNLGEAYTFLMQNWRPGDRVYIFGFSRGAYTARALAGMLNKPGIMRPGSENLVPYALSVYATNEEKIGKVEERLADFSTAFSWVTKDHPLWSLVKRNDPSQISRYGVPIAYVGVWDTVKAAGFLRLGRLRWLYTRTLPNVDRIRHAVSIDEHRRPYREYLVKPLSGRVENNPGTLEEAWFAGVHSDVGGTFDHKKDEPILSTIALKWIVDGTHGELVFKPGAYETNCAVTEANAQGTVHRMGWIWILAGYRRRPIPEQACLHASVRARRAHDPSYLKRLTIADDDPRWVDPHWADPQLATPAGLPPKQPAPLR